MSKIKVHAKFMNFGFFMCKELFYGKMYKIKLLHNIAKK